MIASQVADEADSPFWVGGLDYSLPEELIAQHPAPRRDEARLMVVDRARGTISHAVFREIPRWLDAESVLVANDSAVMPARLLGRKESGGRIEVLVIAVPEAGPVPVLFRASRPPAEGRKIHFESSVEAVVVGPVAGGRCFLDFGAESVRQVLERLGSVPLPAYIRRPEGPGSEDRLRYQTVYARPEGSVAAPTAGLHFTEPLLAEIRAGGTEFLSVTLHVGPGTFAPVRDRLEDHRMEAERCIVAAETAARLNDARRSGKRIVSVGTTTVRALESAAAEDGTIRALDAPSELFIRPGYVFRAVDRLVTNFHLPGSTLLALVMALAGEPLIRRAYEEAVAERYRFYSYGDAMLIL